MKDIKLSWNANNKKKTRRDKRVQLVIYISTNQLIKLNTRVYPSLFVVPCSAYISIRVSKFEPSLKSHAKLVELEHGLEASRPPCRRAAAARIERPPRLAAALAARISPPPPAPTRRPQRRGGPNQQPLRRHAPSDPRSPPVRRRRRPLQRSLEAVAWPLEGPPRALLPLHETLGSRRRPRLVRPSRGAPPWY